MARIINPLTVTEIKQAKPKAKEYKLADGKGLYLLIKANGHKSWLFNYLKPADHKRTNLKLGEYPTMSINEAREIRAEYRELLAKEIDPKLKDFASGLFKVIAKAWYEDRKTRANFSERTAKQTWRLIERMIFPAFANTPISQITPLMAINHFKEIEKNGGSLVTIKKAIQKLNEIMTYAEHREIISYNPTLKIGLEFDNPKTKHYETIKPEELGDFVKDLLALKTKRIYKHLILWQLLTMTRPAETAGAKYSDIDETAGIWTVEINKGAEKGRLHTVPLTAEALELLQEIKKYRRGAYLFPHQQRLGHHINVQTANGIIKRMKKYKLTAHGLRSIASTYLNEQGENPELIEVCLSHLNGDKVRQAYNRAEYLKDRRKIMERWAGYITEQAGPIV